MARSPRSHFDSVRPHAVPLAKTCAPTQLSSRHMHDHRGVFALSHAQSDWARDDTPPPPSPSLTLHLPVSPPRCDSGPPWPTSRSTVSVRPTNRSSRRFGRRHAGCVHCLTEHILESISLVQPPTRAHSHAHKHKPHASIASQPTLLGRVVRSPLQSKHIFISLHWTGRQTYISTHNISRLSAPMIRAASLSLTPARPCAFRAASTGSPEELPRR
jgi:hypothetical protein